MATQIKQTSRSSQNFNPSPDDWQEYATRGADQLRDAVRDNAGRSMLVALAAGLGVGVLIGTALGDSHRSKRWWDRSTAEGFGRRLLDKVEGFVPDAVNDRIHR